MIQLIRILGIILLTSGCVSSAQKILASQKPDFLAHLPKIDTHEHFKAGGNLPAYLEVMDRFGIEKAVFVPTGAAPDNRGYQENMAALLDAARQYPDKIIPFASVDEADPEAPRILEEAVQKGARGLKLLGGHPNLYDEPLDSPRMMTLLAKVRELKIPVLIHISPVKISKQASEFENLVRSFPEVTVIAAHYGRTAPDFTLGRRWLDTYPNLFMDVSMGGGLPRYQKEIQTSAKAYRDFILQYQDRLMWGTDVIVTRKTKADFIRERMGMDFLILGKAFYVDLRPEKQDPAIRRGLDLPEPVLKKIFYENPKRILRI